MISNIDRLKDLIKNKAKGNGQYAQILLRIFMMERLLERISESCYRDNFILKGGLLVASFVGVDMRSTMDMDTTVRSLTLDSSTATKVLEDIFAVQLDDNISFNITKVGDIMEGNEYQGLRYHIQGQLGSLRQTIKIDISTGDVITPGAIEYDYPLLLENKTIRLWSYNIETLLAEKMQTILVRGETTTRMRDFYDIYVLMDEYRNTIDIDSLKNAFTATCRKRNCLNQIAELNNVIAAIMNSEVMQSQWIRYINNNEYAKGLDWKNVILKVADLAHTILS